MVYIYKRFLALAEVQTETADKLTRRIINILLARILEIDVTQPPRSWRPWLLLLPIVRSSDWRPPQPVEDAVAEFRTTVLAQWPLLKSMSTACPCNLLKPSANAADPF